MKVPMIAAMLSAMALAVADPQAGYAALMATQAAGTQFRINFTRSNEKEADAIGIKLMSQSGYDTDGMPNSLHFARALIAALFLYSPGISSGRTAN